MRLRRTAQAHAAHRPNGPARTGRTDPSSPSSQQASRPATTPSSAGQSPGSSRVDRRVPGPAFLPAVLTSTPPRAAHSDSTIDMTAASTRPSPRSSSADDTAHQDPRPGKATTTNDEEQARATAQAVNDAATDCPTHRAGERPTEPVPRYVSERTGRSSRWAE